MIYYCMSSRPASLVIGCDLNFAFPLVTLSEIDVSYAVALSHRVTFVGALEWEQHVPAIQAAQTYNLIMMAGLDLGVRNARIQTLNSL